MKLTLALIAAIAGTALADSAQTAQAISEQAKKIGAAVDAFDAAVKSYSGGDASKLTSASNAIGEAVKAAQGALGSAAPLTLTDALGIQPLFNTLQASIDQSMSDLTAIKSKLVESKQGCEVQKQLSAQEAGSSSLASLITSKVPPEVKAVAETLAGKVGSSITTAKAAFADACTGGSDAPSSGSGSGAHSGGHSGSGSGSGAGSASGSGSSGSSGSRTGSASSGSASSAVPKPAVYTGAGASNAPAFGAAVLAVFALAL